MHPADVSGGMGGSTPQYPEQWKRERMLWFVHEWIEEHQVGEDYVPEISVFEVIRCGDEEEGLTGVRAANLFKQLVEEGYISVNFLDTSVDGPPWLRAAPQSLSTKGLLEIGELPDPDEKLASALAATRQAIEREPSIPEPQKRDMLDTLMKMSTLVNNVRGVGQAIIQDLSKWEVDKKGGRWPLARATVWEPYENYLGTSKPTSHFLLRSIGHRNATYTHMAD